MPIWRIIKMPENLIKHIEGIAYATGESKHIDLNNNIAFRGVTLKHIAGSAAGTNAYIANTVFEWIRVYARGKIIADLVGDAIADAIPEQIQLLREMNKLRQGVAETDEYFNIVLPQAFPAGHNAYVDFKFRAAADLQDGTTAATFTGTVDIFMDKTPPKKAIDFRINSGKFVYAANAGNIAHFLNPSEAGFKCAFIMILIEDNGTNSDTAITNITLKKGTEILQEGSIADFRVKTLAKNHIATSTGFAKIPVGRPIRSNDLQLIVYISSAGTAIDLHWLMVQMR